MTSKKSKTLPSWKLTDLYKGMEDPKISKDLKLAKNLALRFREKYYGKLAQQVISTQKFIALLKQYEQIYLILLKPYNFASLLFADSSTVAGRGAFLQKVQSEFIAIQNLLAFFNPELLAIKPNKLKKLHNDKYFVQYRNFLTVLLKSQPHQLPEKEKQIFSDLSLTGTSAFTRLFEEEFSTRKYQFIAIKSKRSKANSKDLTLTEILDLLHSSDRITRKNAQLGFSKGLAADSKRLAYIYNTLIQDKAIRDRHHNFVSPESERHLDNQIEQKAVDSLVKTVSSSYQDVASYYKIKAKLLKVNKLYDYDRYAPVLGKEPKTPFNKAKEDIIEAFTVFDPIFGKITKEFFDKSWVDAADRQGKRGGAFCSFCTPDLHPYVFMNYSGTCRDVFTLAHELGHGIHAYLMGKQSFLNFDTPLTIAETASVFAELLLFDHLVKKSKTNEAKLRLYLRHIENIIATVHRQISMFQFERDVHATQRKQGELSPSEINALWRNRQLEMFKGSVELTPEYDFWWSYIPHFIHTPFYVYAYSFGQLLALGFFKLYKANPKAFAEHYIEFLSAGNSKSPKELLKLFNIDISKPFIWQEGVKLFKGMLKEAEALELKVR